MRALARGPKSWLVPAGFTVGLSCFVFPLQNPDLWWHLSAARWMVEHHAWPRADFLSHTLAGAKWVDFEWGTQLLYLGLRGAAGDAGLLALKLVLLGLMVWTTLRLLALYGIGAPGRALGALILCTAILPLSDLRPDNFSLLFFNLLLLRLEQRRLGRPFTRRTWALMAPLFFVWANLHLAFLYGLLLIGLYGVGELAEALKPAVEGRGRAGRLDGVRELAGWGALGAAATLINPYAGDLYGVLRAHQADLGALQDIINEWQLPDATPLLRPYWALLALAFAAALLHFLKTRRTPLPLLGCLLYFGLASSSHQRHVAYLCLTAVPVLFLTASELLASAPALRAPAAWAGGVYAAVLLLHISLAMPNLWLRWDGPLSVEPCKPVAQFLLKEEAALGGRKLSNVWGDGGCLGWELYPRYRVFYDGRYIFHHELLEVRTALRSAKSWGEHLDRHGVDLVLMRRAKSMRGELATGARGRRRMLARPFYTGYLPEERWALVYWNDADLVFARRSAVDAAWLARTEYRHLKPGDVDKLDFDVGEGRLSPAALRRELTRHREQVGGVNADTDPVWRWLAALEQRRRR